MRQASKLIACSEILPGDANAGTIILPRTHGCSHTKPLFQSRQNEKLFLRGSPDNYVSSDTSDDPEIVSRPECLKSPVIVSSLSGMNKGRLKQASRYNSLLAQTSVLYGVSGINPEPPFSRRLFPLARQSQSTWKLHRFIFRNFSTFYPSNWSF